jgi:uncharacterized protein
MPEDSEHFEEGQQDTNPEAERPSFFPSREYFESEDSVSRPVSARLEGVFERESEFHIEHLMLLTADNFREIRISIGAAEAKAILDASEKIVPDRPMTHDLLKNVIDRLGATVDRVVIDDAWSDKYYAKIYLLCGREEIQIDARPSDAVATALRFEAPIFVESKVFDLVHTE